MDAIQIEAQPRETGTRAARAVRRGGEVPCVLYGHNVEPVTFRVPKLELHPLIYTDEFRRIKLSVEGQSWDCIVKNIDFHPVSEDPIHADFQVLLAGEKISLTVPIHFEGTPVGQTEGGDTQFIMNEIAITCLPKDIPDHISIDVSGLSIGDSLHVSDLEIEGVEFDAEDRQTLVTVVPPRLEPVEEEEEGLLLEGELEEGEEGAEGEAAEGESEGVEG